MKTAVFDIEGNGLLNEITKIHCLVYKDVNTGEVFKADAYEDIEAFFEEYDCIIGHNIIQFDLPALKKVMGIEYKGRVIDTLALSWYLNVDWLRHGLESIGEKYGIPKPKIDDWEGLTLEEYLHRCTEDVTINFMFWEECWDKLMTMYGRKVEANKIINYLTFKMQCAARQSELGWKLDVGMTKEWVDKLGKELEERSQELINNMPKRPIYKSVKRPAKMFKLNGSISVAGQKWNDLVAIHGLPEGDELEYISSYEDGNPGSPLQIKDWLFSLGWEPCTFEYKRDDSTRELRAIPQVYIKGSGGQLSPSVERLAEKSPDILPLVGLSVAKHRFSILTGFLKNCDEDGYLRAEIQGLTNTLRFKHKSPLVNLPGAERAYGDIVRGVLICDEDEELCGSDMSSLEDRTKQHFIYPYDPEYVEEMNKPDFDPHLDLALLAKKVTEDQVEGYKKDTLTDAVQKTVKGLRHTYKQANYASVYGATAPRLAITAGISVEEAQAILDIYWERNWSVKALAEDLTVEEFHGNMWLLNPVNGFWYSLRSDKDRFSTLNQGTGVFCFDTWVREVRTRAEGKFDKVIAQFHDEIVLRIKKSQREEVREFLLECIEAANEKLKLNRSLDIDVQFGDNYAAIH